jgi:hypothetical protein
MKKTERLVEILKRHRFKFFHFTDTRNLPSIRESGLLSMKSIRANQVVVAPGGNSWSLDADRRTGMDDFVHLCFFNEHPMEFLALKDGRIQESRFLRISPEVLLAGGVLITDMVSNRADANPKPAEEMIDKLDLEVIYTRTDWKDPKIQMRLRAARRCEILVPKSIPLKFIGGLK